MDAMTGLLLIFFPARVLELLGLPPLAAESMWFLQWIGVFVAGVGCSYLFAQARRGQGEAIWYATAMIRTMVAVFLTVTTLAGDAPMQWLTVAGTDAVVALVQIAVNRAGWWAEFRQYASKRHHG